MRTRSIWSRRSAFLTLLFHLLVVGLGPVADARLEGPADEAHASLHMEDANAPDCSPGHDHSHCLICRTLHGFDAPPEGGARLQLALDPEARILPPVRVALRSLVAAAPLGPRGPPVA